MPAPNFRFRIGDKVIEGPGDKFSELKAMYPNAQNLGPSPLRSAKDIDRELTVGEGFAPAVKARQAFQEFVKSDKFPAVAGATAMGLATGGMGLIPAAGLAALGAGGGEAFRQVAQQAQGKGPKTSQEAVDLITARGAEGALGEVGGRGAVGALKKVGQPIVKFGKEEVLPALVSLYSRASRPAARMGVTAEKDILTPKNVDVEAPGRILGTAKEKIAQARTALGKKVGSAVSAFDEGVNGARIIDASDIPDRYSKAVEKTPGVPAKVNEILGRLKNVSKPKPSGLVGPTGQPIPDVAAGIVEKLSPAELYEIKRDLQYLTDHGVMDPTGTMLQRIDKKSPAGALIKKITEDVGKRLVESEQRVLGTSAIAQANKEFSKNAKVYDFLEKHLLRGEAGQPEARAAAMFARGQAPKTRAVAKVEQMLPQEQQFLGELNTAIAAGQLDPTFGNVAATGSTGELLYGLTQGRPTALLRAPFLSPRYGTKFARGVARGAQGALDLATGPFALGAARAGIMTRKKGAFGAK